MRFIVGNLVYDTEKATLLCSGRKDWEINTVFGVRFMDRQTYLYKTNKGNYFFTYVGDYERHYMRPCTELEAKAWFARTDYDKYVEVFGSLEEA